jgi:Leucine-rich repeat (LRR) protein
MQNIPVSIQEFKKLEELNIKNNPDLNLKKTFETLSSVATLKVLELGISRNIIEIPANINKLKNLEKLYITSTAIETLPEEIGDLENLVLLNLYANRYLELLPLSISNLKKLEIINLESMTSRFNYAISFQHLSLCPNLKKLMLSSTHHIQKFPSEIGSIKSLEYLDISSCTNLIEIPKEIGQLENLKYLDIGASVKIEFIPEEIVNLKNIETLSIGGQVGYSFKIEFEKLSKLPKLSTIIIDWGEQKIPNSIKNFIVLTTLQMNDYQREFITTEERERILELIPNCRIIYNE